MRKITIEQKVRKIIREEILKESLQSSKLRKLINTELKGDYKRIFNSISKYFKIAIDQVTDDDVMVVRGPAARKIMTDPTKLGIFIWKGKDTWQTPAGLMGMRLGKKFISAATDPAQKRWVSKDTPKNIKNQKYKYSYLSTDTGIRGTTGSSRNGGLSRYSGESAFSAGDYWSDDVIVYIIDVGLLKGTAADKIDSRQANSDVFDSFEYIRKTNRDRYKQALANLRSTRNPEFIIEFESQLKALGVRVEKVTSKVIADPAKYRYSNAEGILPKLLGAYSSLDYIINDFKSGDITWDQGWRVKELPKQIRELMQLLDFIEKK